MPERAGKYRINAVAEQTGVAATTLRAWERRYGLPDPGRTDSAHRLYSEHDIAMVRRVRELCDEGMSASQAAKTVLDEAASWTESPANAADPFAGVREALVRAVFAFDPAQVDSAIRHAMVLGPATGITDKVFVPAMREIGDAWHAGELSVAQEHMATQKLNDAVAGMLSLIAPTDADRTVAIACFEDEEHTFPSASLALHLASWGHRVVRLGARTPPTAVRDLVEHVEPDLVCLSVTISPDPPRGRKLVDAYARACGNVPWVVGGAAAPSMAKLVERRGGHVVPNAQATNLRGTLEAMMAAKRRS